MEGLVNCDRGGKCCLVGGSLAVLNEVQKAYEDRMQVIEKVGGNKKLQLQVEALQSWVGDLVGQNTLLARTVQELEHEATARIVAERNRHAEIEMELRTETMALRRRLARKESDLRGLVEVLRRLREFDYCTLEGIHFFEVTESDIFGPTHWRQKKMEQGDTHRTAMAGFAAGTAGKTGNAVNGGKGKKRPSVDDTLLRENLAKEREIRRLNKDVQKYEQTILNMRSELANPRIVDCPKKDAEVMVGMSYNQDECGAKLDGESYGGLLKDESAKLQDRLRKMENNLKGSGEQVRSLRKVNVALSEELHALRRVCAALDEQCRASATRTAFKDDIIREMRRQLKQAKAKLKEGESADSKSVDYGDKHRSSGSYGAVERTQPRRLHSTLSQLTRDRDREDHNIPTQLRHDSESPRFDGSGDESLCFKAD
ncbi:hypothetical protein O0L34_g3758 [Tuta absoluta]|nr:hypothetical protein O0L34_g3758 [Tuta absoluta]